MPEVMDRRLTAEAQSLGSLSPHFTQRILVGGQEVCLLTSTKAVKLLNFIVDILIGDVWRPEKSAVGFRGGKVGSGVLG
jgi:hypothetical protein